MKYLIIKNFKAEIGTETFSFQKGQIAEMEGESVNFLLSTGYIRQEPFPCYACGNINFWRSESGKVICGICHPPMEDTEIIIPRIRKFDTPLYDRPIDRACPKCGSLFRWENKNNVVSCPGCFPNTNTEAVWQWYKVRDGKLNPIDCPTITKSDFIKE